MAASATLAGPVQICYEVADLGAGHWQYTYEVFNDSLPVPIEEFTIWFGLGQYLQLVVETQNPPAGDWDELVVDPDPIVEDDGFYDALELAGGITAGHSVSGFSVSFAWLGEGTPGPQFFEVIDPDTFETIHSGITVPEPATLVLLGMALMLCRPRCR